MLAFSPDGRHLVSATQEPSDPVVVWDMTNFQAIAHIETGYNRRISAIGLHPNNQMFITAGDEGDLKLWKLSTGEPFDDGMIQGHNAPIHALAFLPGTGTLATASDEHVIKLWDMDTGTQITSLLYQLPYEGLNLTRTTGLSEAQIQSLISFGAHLAD